VSSTLRDPKISQVIKRHFVAVAFDANTAPTEVKAAFTRTGNQRFPFVLYLNDKGQLIHGTSGGRSAEDLRADLDKALNDKSLELPKNRETELTKLVDTLEKQLEEKKHKEAIATFNSIQKFRGYSAAKDRAFDLMDKAQEGGLKSLDEALAYAGRDEYERAKDILEKVPTDFAGLPVADQAKEHLNVVKALEAAHQPTKEKKGNWRQTAVQRLAAVVRNYADTPYANLANQRQQDLIKGK
jgi:ribosomal protein L20